MNASAVKQIGWIEILALTLAFIGVLVAAASSILVMTYQAESIHAPVWPLPGLVMLDWVGLGLVGFLGPLLGLRLPASFWARINIGWVVVGALLPLAILGAFSIGLFVLVSLCFFLVSAVLISLHRKMNWLLNLGLLIMGAFANLALLLALIAVGNLLL